MTAQGIAGQAPVGPIVLLALVVWGAVAPHVGHAFREERRPHRPPSHRPSLRRLFGPSASWAAWS